MFAPDLIGVRVVAIDDRQDCIRGVLVGRDSAHAVIEIAPTRGIRRRRRFHLRFVYRDWP